MYVYVYVYVCIYVCVKVHRLSTYSVSSDPYKFVAAFQKFAFRGVTLYTRGHVG